MEPFRTSSQQCPECGRALRSHGKRLVCDDCQGMLLSSADLEASLRETGDVESTTLAASDVRATETACPRCTKPMQRATLDLGDRRLEGRYLWCEDDGAWLSHDQLVAELAHTGRRPSGVVRSTSAAAAYLAPSGSPAAAALGIGRAFTQNQRAPLSYRPPKHTAFVSQFEGRTLPCPSCEDHPALGFVGDRWACKSCAGTFVEDAALIAMVSDITNEPWEVPDLGVTTGQRACPACGTRMAVQNLGDVEIDRCGTCGIWFDADELGTVLLAESEPAEENRGIAGWLKRLFSR